LVEFCANKAEDEAERQACLMRLVPTTKTFCDFADQYVNYIYGWSKITVFLKICIFYLRYMRQLYNNDRTDGVDISKKEFITMQLLLMIRHTDIDDSAGR
jgi:hypothetical protein